MSAHTPLDSLRALCRYETHGGYVWAGVMTDGALICVPCLRGNYRQIFRATCNSADRSDWALAGMTNSGEADDESREYCEQCNNLLWGD